MDNMIILLIQVISGALAGTATGATVKDLSLGTSGNAVAGMLGGVIGGQIFDMLGMAVTGTRLETDVVDTGIVSLLQSVAGGVVGGSTLQVIIGAVKISLGK